MISTDLGKQQELDTDGKTVQQINFTDSLDLSGSKTMFFITEEAKETILNFS